MERSALSAFGKLQLGDLRLVVKNKGYFLGQRLRLRSRFEVDGAVLLLQQVLVLQAGVPRVFQILVASQLLQVVWCHLLNALVLVFFHEINRLLLVQNIVELRLGEHILFE